MNRNHYMKIETYEVEEINSSEASTMAADSEALDLVERLGLEGQKSLSNKDTGTRQPYRKITALEKIVFETLLPNRTKLENYSDGIIPLRVLQVVAHCKEQHFFDRYYILHPEPGKKDPVLVGFKVSDSRYEWSGDDFLLARWGEAFESFEQLTAKACKIWKAQMAAKLKKAQQEIANDIENLDAVAQEMFLTGKQKAATYSGF